MTTYLGFAIANSMFPEDCTVRKLPITIEQVQQEISGDISICANPSHLATFAALKVRHAIELEVPDSAPIVSLDSGDSIIVLSVVGLPRLIDRHEYTADEIDSSTFTFSKYIVKI